MCDTSPFDGFSSFYYGRISWSSRYCPSCKKQKLIGEIQLSKLFYEKNFAISTKRIHVNAMQYTLRQ